MHLCGLIMRIVVQIIRVLKIFVRKINYVNLRWFLPLCVYMQKFSEITQGFRP
jgi:hypothetical protein